MAHSNYVYVVEMVSTPGLVKIGFAKDPQRRMDYLQISSPGEISLRAAVLCDSREHAMSVESAAHQMFALRRTYGEWFQLDSAGEAAIAVRHLARVSPTDRSGGSPSLLNRALSPREAQVVEMYGSGLRCTDIAVALGRSVKTVSTYAVRAAKKLGLKSTREIHHYVRSRADAAQATP